MAIQWMITKHNIYGNSKLIMNQTNDVYKTNDDKIMPYKRVIDDLKKYIIFVTFQKIPRNENNDVNTIDTLASML